MKRECGFVDRRNERGVYNDMILADRRWWMCCDWGGTQLPTWRRLGMHLKNDMSLEHVLLHGYDVLAFFLCESMHGAALEHSAVLGELKCDTDTVSTYTQTHTTPRGQNTWGMLLNKSAANTLAAAAASAEPPLLPAADSDFEGGASRASAAARAAAFDSARAALTRAWLRLKGAEKSPADR